MNNTNDKTHIRVKRSTKHDLELLKVHKNQPFDEIIIKLLKERKE